MGSSLLKVALPIAGSLIAPGIGTALGSTLSGAALSGIGGALGGGLGGAIGGGGISGALTGAALGGTGGYLANGGLSSISSGLYGDAAHTLAGGVQGPVTSATSGLIGSGGQGFGSSLLSGASGGGASAFGSGAKLSSVLGGISNLSAQDDIEKQLLEQQGRSEAALAPYLKTGTQANQMLSDKLASGELGGTFNPGDLTKDPGYQFALEQGQTALDRQQAAKGGYFSGAALKSAQDYGQGLANQTYNDAYNRWLQGQQNTYGQLSGVSNTGQSAAGTQANINDNIGNIRANNTLSGSNTLNSVMASLLGGSGARQIVGYKADGTPIYSDNAMTKTLVLQ